MANLSNINNVLRVSSDLRVGINTDAASYALEIGGTNSGIKLKNSGGSGKVYSILSDTSGNFQIYDDAAASGRLVINDIGNATFAGSINAGQRIKIGTGGTYEAGSIYSDSAYGMIFRALQASPSTADFLFTNSANVARLTIDDDGDATFAGNVGINTAATNATLIVTGDVSDDWAGRFENTNTGGFGILSKINSTSSGDIILEARTGSTSVFKVTGDSNSTFAGNILMGNTVVNPASGFADQTGIGLKYSTTVPEIQVSSDSSAMQLGRTTTGGDGQILALRKAGTIIHNFDTNNVNIGTDATFAGNVDIIKTTSDVAGELRIGGILASDNLPFGKINFANTAAANSQTNDVLAYIAGEKTGSSNRGELTFATSNDSAPVERLRIDSSGNVGIGVTTVTAGSGWNRVVEIHAAGGTGSHISLTDSTSGTGPLNGTFFGHYSADTYLINREAGNILFWNNGSEKIRIESGGNVRVNFNQSGSAGNLYFQDIDNGASMFYIQPAQYVGSAPYNTNYINAANNSNIGFIAGGSEKMRITSAGGISFGSTGTAYGTSGQVLTSNGNATPTWQAAGGSSPWTTSGNNIYYTTGNVSIGTSSTSFNSSYDNLIVGTGSGDNGIGIYSGTTSNSTLAFLASTGGQSDFEIRVEHDYPFGNMEVYFQHGSDNYLRMFERNNGQDPIIKVGQNDIPLGLNSGDDAIMQFRPESNNWYPAIAINAEDSQGNNRGFIEMKSNRSSTSSADYFLKFFNVFSNEIGSIRVNNNNNNVAYNTSSDYRLKEDLKEFKALDTVCKIKVYNYTWKDDPSDFRDQGILAHELDELIPQAVSGEKDALDKDDNILPQSVDYSKIVPHLVQSIQELKAEIEILKNK